MFGKEPVNDFVQFQEMVGAVSLYDKLTGLAQRQLPSWVEMGVRANERRSSSPSKDDLGSTKRNAKADQIPLYASREDALGLSLGEGSTASNIITHFRKMTSRRIVSTEKNLLEKDDGNDSSPSASEKSNITPAVPA